MDTIILPVDLSRQSKMMIPCMVEFSRFGIRKVIVLYVNPEGVPLTKITLDELNDFVNQLCEEGFDAELKISTGLRPYEVIIHCAEELGADTIVMPSSGKGRATMLLLGSNSLSVLRKASVQVLLKRFIKGPGGSICETFPLTFKKVMVVLPPMSRDNGFMERVNRLIKRGRLDNVLILNPVSGAKMEYSYSNIMSPEEIYKKMELGEYDIGSVPRNILDAIVAESISLLVLPGCLREPMHSLLKGSPIEQILQNSKASLMVIPTDG
ncbi:MAG: hypothetical protein PWQ88_55 [Candidatus Methanomethylophilaceae archaeon]|nr:hypothetical protein [Candidatus Methanomethylophilaceae archaeon]MDI3541804.1 hypothetical protein [Candidatus Methanomethylophilaceae archaeon]HIJ00281.1 universal stress protein [Candidatus Methanomethylophilaceae archaeon]